MYIDRIDLTLPEADVATILAAFTSAEASLEFLPSVSIPDRKRYAKLGLKNESLAKQIIEVGRANPDLIPRGIDFQKIDRDLVAREQLRTLKIILERLLGRVNDAMLLTGVDIYAAALSIYHCLRRNADTASLKETVDELKRGFARPSRKKKEQQEDVPTATPEPKPPTPHAARYEHGAEATKPALTKPSNAPAATDGRAPASSVPKTPQTRASTTFTSPLEHVSQFVPAWCTPSIPCMAPEPIQIPFAGFHIAACSQQPLTAEA